VTTGAAGRDAAAGQVGRVGSDRGSATVWLLVAGLVLVLFSLGGSAIGAARVARHQARVAADLGALAGAARVLEGPDSACARAAAIAAANSARITSCTLDGLDLQITTEVRVEPLPGLSRNARATSRAGPVRSGAEQAAARTTVAIRTSEDRCLQNRCHQNSSRLRSSGVEVPPLR
jgi:secretion/DNA translocation related TadE-like protein